MDINFEYYKTFYYVAKYKNLTKAAAAMGSNQPNVTRVMKLLESQLSAKLFIREARGIVLTKEGEDLYVHVETAFRELTNAQEEISAQSVDGTGTIEIGATETAIHHYLLDALRKFKAMYPRVRIRIHNHTTPAIFKRLANGSLDFAVLTSPFEIGNPFVKKELFSFREILTGGVQYLNLGKRKWKLEELKDYPWVGLGEGTATYEMYKELFLKNGVDIEPDMEVATSDLLFPLIKNNMGIGFIPESVATLWIKKQQLVQIPLECELPIRKIELVYDKGRVRSAIADEFISQSISVNN